MHMGICIHICTHLTQSWNKKISFYYIEKQEVEAKRWGGTWYGVGAADRVRPEDCLEGERRGSWGSF